MVLEKFKITDLPYDLLCGTLRRLDANEAARLFASNRNLRLYYLKNGLLHEFLESISMRDGDPEITVESSEFEPLAFNLMTSFFHFRKISACRQLALDPGPENPDSEAVNRKQTEFLANLRAIDCLTVESDDVQQLERQLAKFSDPIIRKSCSFYSNTIRGENLKDVVSFCEFFRNLATCQEIRLEFFGNRLSYFFDVFARTEIQMICCHFSSQGLADSVQTILKKGFPSQYPYSGVLFEAQGHTILATIDSLKGLLVEVDGIELVDQPDQKKILLEEADKFAKNYMHAANFAHRAQASHCFRKSGISKDFLYILVSKDGYIKFFGKIVPKFRIFH